ncbi:MAG: hypothetical protein ABI700_09160 [Chloroflexota bacterium]
MADQNVLFDTKQTAYTEKVAEFLQPLDSDERWRQEMDAVNTLILNFQRMGLSAKEAFAKGKPVGVTSDAFFRRGTERLTAVIVGEFAQRGNDFSLTVQYMLPEEFDRDILAGSHKEPSEWMLVLLSMDEAKIRAYCERMGMAVAPLSSSSLPFWIEVHTFRELMFDLPMEERLKSKQWLDERHVVRPPDPYSLSESPSLQREYPISKIIYVQPVYRMEPDGTLITWLELISEGKVVRRLPVNGWFKSEPEVIEAGLKARAEAIARLREMNPDMPVMDEGPR